jgi:hypothetical protein
VPALFLWGEEYVSFFFGDISPKREYVFFSLGECVSFSFGGRKNLIFLGKKNSHFSLGKNLEEGLNKKTFLFSEQNILFEFTKLKIPTFLFV